MRKRALPLSSSLGTARLWRSPYQLVAFWAASLADQGRGRSRGAEDQIALLQVLNPADLFSLRPYPFVGESSRIYLPQLPVPGRLPRIYRTPR